ncbi:MAG: N-acetylmuramoyl-L-alanine amidase [Candidatus Gracilibacteria bacterium]|nr:N-acetylmuramoyl-L-alanine amidase [Candidatus Gracilibacteria bacterium]
MRKIFYTFILLSLIFFKYGVIFAAEDIKIISRKEWGATEEYIDLNSSTWKNILLETKEKKEKEGNKISDKKNLEEIQKIYVNADMKKYLRIFFSEDRKIKEKITHYNTKKLAWPIEVPENVSGIVIHHTVTDGEDMYKTVRDIYKHHAVLNQWGDIGYNFLIGKNGEIFEGRLGGETAVGAHNKWNNIGNIGIAMIGDYSEQEINSIQEKSLKNLMSYLVRKYNIDLNGKKYLHIECNDDYCEHPLYSYQYTTISGHRDAAHKDCPGDKLYAQINGIIYSLKITHGELLVKEKIMRDFIYQLSYQQKLKLQIFLDKKTDSYEHTGKGNWKKYLFFKEFSYAIEHYSEK